MTAHWRAQCLLNQFRASVYKFCEHKNTLKGFFISKVLQLLWIPPKQKKVDGLLVLLD